MRPYKFDLMFYRVEDVEVKGILSKVQSIPSIKILDTQRGTLDKGLIYVISVPSEG